MKTPEAISKEQRIKELEEALRQKELQLEAANNELETFSYSVSHDLRAPLRIIKGFSEVVLEDHAGGLNDEAKNLLNSIRRTALRMDELIRALLVLSKAGRQEMQMSDINMTKLAKDVFNELTRGYVEKKPLLEVKALSPARGDASLIRQVFANLLSNAVKFSGQKEAAEIEVGGWTEDRENIYFVKDNGAGFDPRNKNKLFGAFQRLHTLKEFEGTGVGLSIVQRIITRHGGRVWADGKPDEGAVFYFSLPKV